MWLNPLSQNTHLGWPLFAGKTKKPAPYRSLSMSTTRQPMDQLQVSSLTTRSNHRQARIFLLPENGIERLLDKIGPQALRELASRMMVDKPFDGRELIARYETRQGRKHGFENLRTMTEAFQKQLQALPAKMDTVTVELPRKLPDGVSRDMVIRELARITALEGYNYNFHKQMKRPSLKLQEVIFNKEGLQTASAKRLVQEGQTIGEAMNLARHFVDSPANLKTTRYMADKAKGLASATLAVNIREGAFLEGKSPENTKRMGLFLSVAQGNAPQSDRAPRLVEMIYTPKNGQYDKTILLVGKGIVFDTGGNNLKPSEYIHRMEGDMAGAAAVIATMKALDETQLPGVRVIGLAPLTENRLGSAATLPNDIHTARNGKTVQISNTDAEGRLILSDAIHYGMETYQPDLVADIATLTGGKIRGVGAQNAVALSGNNPSLMKAVHEIESRQLGRRSVMLPLTQNHHRWVTRENKGKANVFNSVSMADARHFGVLSPFSNDQDAMLQHSAQGAAFLREFLPKGQEKTPWVHYDMAGAEFHKPDPRRGNEEWATGFGVEELYSLVKAVSEGQIKPDAGKSEGVKSR